MTTGPARRKNRIKSLTLSHSSDREDRLMTLNALLVSPRPMHVDNAGTRSRVQGIVLLTCLAEEDDLALGEYEDEIFDLYAPRTMRELLLHQPQFSRINGDELGADIECLWYPELRLNGLDQSASNRAGPSPDHGRPERRSR